MTNETNGTPKELVGDEAKQLFGPDDLFVTKSRCGNPLIGCSSCGAEFMKLDVKEGRCPSCGIEFAKASLL